MAKLYPDNSTLTVRQRVERTFNAKHKHNPLITVHNCDDGDGFLFSFYLDDYNNPYEDAVKNKEMDYRVVIETKSNENIVLGISYKEASK